jgi:hypothetical protein
MLIHLKCYVDCYFLEPPVGIISNILGISNFSKKMSAMGITVCMSFVTHLLLVPMTPYL